MFLFALWFILCQTFTTFLALSINFTFGQYFQIFMTVVNFKENYFQFKKYTISNFLICQYIIIVLWAPRKLKKSIAAFSIKMTSKMAIFSYSAKDALVGRSPGYWLLGRKYMKKCLFISRQYLVRAVMKYNLYLLFLRIFVNTAGVNSSIFHWKNHQIRLKIENLGCHGNGHADWRKASTFVHHWI